MADLQNAAENDSSCHQNYSVTLLDPKSLTVQLGESWVEVEPDVQAGGLVRVLPEWRTGPASVCALFPSNPRLPVRVRLFLDAIAERLADIETLEHRPGNS
jgi:hypothetical protein